MSDDAVSAERSNRNTGGWRKGLLMGILSLGLLVTAAACGGGDDKADQTEVDPQGEVVELSARERSAARTRERRRQRAAAAEEADFSYFRYRIDTTGEAPLACFVFSAPLDEDFDYAPFVEFRPAFRPALSVQGRDLCVGGMTFGSNRTATLLSGLPSADGRALTRDEAVPIDFADRPAYVGFKGTGVILPREDADGLAIETVNVDQVRIAVSRVNDRALVFKDISQGETTQQGRYSYSYGRENPNDVAEELWTGTMDVAAEQNAPIISVFPLQSVIGTLEPGAYYIEVSDAADLIDGAGPPASSRRWILLSDLALTAYEGLSGLDVTLRSLQDGKPLADTPIQLIAQNNEVLAQARTNEQGRVQFDGPITEGTGTTAPKLIMAQSAKGDIAVLDLMRAPVDLSEHAVGGRRTPGLVDGFVYTDRGIYRPGETVELTALLRGRGGEQIDGRSGHLIVYRPNGLEAEKTRFSDPDSGAVLHSFALPRGASRGQWRASLVVDGIPGSSGDVRFSVEDFVPQRIAVDLEADHDTPMLKGETRDVTVNSRFLYGAPGAGLTVQANARVEPQANPFDAYEGFRFGRHDATFRERIIQFDDRTTDGAGVTTFRLDPGTRGQNADRPLRLNAVISVLEPGGRAVSESVRVPYRPNDLYLGLMQSERSSMEEGGEVAYQVAAVNAAGDGVSQELNWKVLAIDYHYDWYNDGGTWRWRRSRTVTTVNEGVSTTSAEGTTEIAVGGLNWGSHQLVVETDGAATSDDFYVGWGGRVSEDGTEAPDQVRVMAPEEAPKVGDTAEITIIPPYEGQAQIVVATDRVLSVQNIGVSEDGTSIRLPVTEDWGEGAYVMVTVYTERDPILQAKPRRAVGVVHVPLDMADRTFDITIDAPDVTRPRQTQVIDVSVQNGPREPIYLTIAAVDEGILALTKFQSPDPVSYYYGKKALGVQLYDDYGRLLDPNMGLPAEVRTGGDQLGGEGLSVVPVKSVALFSGLVDVGRSGRTKVSFELPDFNGELRLMAVAWSPSGLGAAEDTMVVRDEAPADLILPRFMAPGDEAFITASIDNVELPAGDFSAVVTGSGPITVPSERMNRTLVEGQRADELVRVEATSEGISRLRYAVEGPQNYGIDHTYLIQTRSPYLPETRVVSELQEGGGSYSVSQDLLEGYVPGSVDVAVSYSSLPVDPGALYASLARYPYGCTEQTVSRAMPLLYSEQLIAMGARENRDDPRGKVQEAVSRILNRQGNDGAFGLWREGDRYASPWLGAYATDFIYRAKEAGYAVPDEALERAYGALQSVSTGESWRVYGYDTDVYESRYSSDTEDKLMDRASAYALYVMAKAGKADVSRLRYMHDRDLEDIDSPLAKAHLGAALAFMGDRARANSAFAAAETALGYDNTGDYYQTPLRDLSAILALAAEANMVDVVERLAGQIGTDTPDPQELTTQEKAFLLLAVDGLAGGDEFRVAVDGLGSGNDNDRRYQLSEAQVASGVTFTLRGDTPAFRTVLVTGAPQSAPAPARSNLQASKTYYTLTGQKVDLSRVSQGDQLVVALTLTPEERRLNPLIVADLLPAGFEIETVLTPADGGAGGGAFGFVTNIARAQTSQAQDDRFVAAIDAYQEPVTLAYVVRAVTPGDFAIPGVVAEDMYRPEVFARSRAGRVVIAPAAGTAAGGK